MCFPSLYRCLLKRIHAAKGHLHHLQDIRFILSYPPVQSFMSTENANKINENSLQKVWQSNQEDVVLACCCKDLRNAILAPTHFSNAAFTSSSAISPIAQQFIHVRELAWLKIRLEQIVSEATNRIQKEAQFVSSKLTKDDFISAEVFDNEEKQENETNGENGNAGGVQEPDEEFVGIPSAGALGPRKEMFIFRHVAPFPLVKEYLYSFNMKHAIDSEATAVVSREQLVDFVWQHVPRHVTCQNKDLTLTVTVRPFDPAVGVANIDKNNSNNHFAQAHRYFVLKFEVQPHCSSYQVDVVNTYFLRLDAVSSELHEDVGHMHAAHVWKLTHETTLRDERKHQRLGKRNDGDVSHQFELVFVNSCDNPMVMKGQLYYTLKTEKDEEYAQELPIRVVSFGHVLLFSGG